MELNIIYLWHFLQFVLAKICYILKKAIFVDGCQNTDCVYIFFPVSFLVHIQSMCLNHDEYCTVLAVIHSSMEFRCNLLQYVQKRYVHKPVSHLTLRMKIKIVLRTYVSLVITLNKCCENRISSPFQWHVRDHANMVVFVWVWTGVNVVLAMVVRFVKEVYIPLKFIVIFFLIYSEVMLGMKVYWQLHFVYVEKLLLFSHVYNWYAKLYLLWQTTNQFWKTFY
jgi:hypothetical protein